MARRKYPYSERLLYAFLIAAVVGAVAMIRQDLVAEAAERSWTIFQRGGAQRLSILFQAVLFAAILAATFWILTRRTDPPGDLKAFCAAVLLGACVESWATRTGLCVYYTGERPPLWILPAWGLGALLIDRLGERLRSAWAGSIGKKTREQAYWTASGAVIAAFVFFSRPAWTSWGTPLLLFIVLAALFARPDPAEDFWPLAAGMAAVFFVDLWGTEARCWRYYLQTEPGGQALGVGFAMLLNATVMLGALRLRRAF